MSQLRARQVFLILTVPYVVLEMLDWVGVVDPDEFSTPARVLLGLFLLAWFGAALATLVAAFRSRRAHSSR